MTSGNTDGDMDMNKLRHIIVLIDSFESCLFHSASQTKLFQSFFGMVQKPRCCVEIKLISLLYLLTFKHLFLF
jgi:hypothetical protein